MLKIYVSINNRNYVLPDQELPYLKQQELEIRNQFKLITDEFPDELIIVQYKYINNELTGGEVSADDTVLMRLNELGNSTSQS